MHDRSALGPADVTDAELTRIVCALLHCDPEVASLLGSVAEPVDYELDAITTAGRWWVRGTARIRDRTADRVVPWELFVKHVQSWSRSPLFRHVPEEHREIAAASVPWRTEPLAYRSDLADRLPPGLRMPRALAVHDLDELSASIWLDVVHVVDQPWDQACYTRAARLLGRLAASPRVAALADVGRHDFDIRRDYLGGRLGLQVIPLLRSDDVWAHPLVAAAFDPDLRRRLLDVADRAGELVDELSAYPRATSHGDACPNNLLRPADPEGFDGFVLIDYGFWGSQPVGFDLTQLLVGEVQVGRRGAEGLADLDEALVAAYVDGLHEEGRDLPADVVRRAHALQLMIFCGLSCLPFEHLDSAPTARLHRLAAARAEIARQSLDLLEATGPHHGTATTQAR